MTEEEAKQKWCPHVRFYAMTVGIGWNRSDIFKGEDGEMPCFCIGSNCMAWRWQVTWGESYDGSKFIILDKPSETEGYCGLAGKP